MARIVKKTASELRKGDRFQLYDRSLLVLDTREGPPGITPDAMWVHTRLLEGPPFLTGKNENWLILSCEPEHKLL